MAKKTVETPKEENAATTEALATQGTTAMAESEWGDDAVAIGEGVAPGYENQTNEDIAIPFLSLLQPLSPAVVKQTVPGAAMGMWLNTLTSKLYKNPEGVLFVPSTTRHEYIQYRPRDHGGGFQGRFSIDAPQVAAAKAWAKANEKEQGLSFGEYYIDSDDGRKGKNGDELVETFTMMGVIIDPDWSVVGPATIGFKSSMIKCYKALMSQIRSVTVEENGVKKIPALYSHVLKFTTEVITKGNNTYAIPVYTAPKGSPNLSLINKTHPAFQSAKSLHRMVVEGQANADYAKSDGSDAPAGEKPPF